MPADRAHLSSCTKAPPARAERLGYRSGPVGDRVETAHHARAFAAHHEPQTLYT